MLVAHRICPHCLASVSKKNPAFCSQCFSSVIADVSEEELKQSGDRYRVIAMSQYSSSTAKEQAFFDDMTRIAASDGSGKPVRHQGSIPGVLWAAKGMRWILIFAVITVVLAVCFFFNFSWYSLIYVLLAFLLYRLFAKHS